MARIATVCTDERRGTERVEMAAIRWYQMSRALSDLGHDVDILHGRYKWRLRQPVHDLGAKLREVPLGRVRWEEYDVVKTLFHRGFETVRRFGGEDHPFLVSKLGSVVGVRDQAGIYFYGDQRARLFQTQQCIHDASRFVTVLTRPARALWRDCHGDKGNILLVPGAAETNIPSPGSDPYPSGGGPRVVFAGNFYSGQQGSQLEAHTTIVEKLNGLGASLRERQVPLYLIGRGDTSRLDSNAVRYLGEVPYERSWDYLRYADVGLVVSAGSLMHNNESTKIYHYLRVGLPVVSESGFPNDYLIEETGHGRLVEPGQPEELSAAVLETVATSWDGRGATEYILKHHTWARRAQVYDEVIRRELGQ